MHISAIPSIGLLEAQAKTKYVQFNASCLHTFQYKITKIVRAFWLVKNVWLVIYKLFECSPNIPRGLSRR